MEGTETSLTAKYHRIDGRSATGRWIQPSTPWNETYQKMAQLLEDGAVSMAITEFDFFEVLWKLFFRDSMVTDDQSSGKFKKI